MKQMFVVAKNPTARNHTYLCGIHKGRGVFTHSIRHAKLFPDFLLANSFLQFVGGSETFVCEVEADVPVDVRISSTSKTDDVRTSWWSLGFRS